MQSTKEQATEQDLIKRLQRDLCINRNNHQKPNFCPIDDFFKPCPGCVKAGFKIAKWVKSGFLMIIPIYAKVLIQYKH